MVSQGNEWKETMSVALACGAAQRLQEPNISQGTERCMLAGTYSTGHETKLRDCWGSVHLRLYGGSCCGSVSTNLTSIHEDVGLIPGLAQWVKDLALPGAVVQVADVAADVAVAQAGGYSLDSTPSLETSICHRCDLPSPQKRCN